MTSRPWRRCVQTLALTIVPLAQAHAQADPAASAPDARMERAQKAADAVFRWIKINADKPGVRPATPTPAAPAAQPLPQSPVPTTPQRRPSPAHTPPTQPPVSQSNANTQGVPAPSPTAAASTPSAAVTSTAAAGPAASVPEPPSTATPRPVDASAHTSPTPAPQPEPSPTLEPEVPLQLRQKVDPVMPRLPAQLQRDGYAQVQFTVQPDGSVSQALVLKTNHPRFGAAAVEAVRQWRFGPIPRTREAAVEIRFSNEN
ncbi:MAG: hypothetical protein DI603_13705 [Roseateles depolymerans]|uniref:TonB C-terminal domain-containing protein n=1 Tax=Roseateles depolymerans TaxID=76731 RepID=A0A2W5FJ60_9BURK|nr:MAG: hypothetical protein DI603_13705 [Roseateles depolymerans]